MRKAMAWLTVLWALVLFCPALADAPPPLHECLLPEEVEASLIQPLYSEDGVNLPIAVQKGEVRYVAQRKAGDPLFCTGYWLGGPEGSDLDLTRVKNDKGEAYESYCNNMCTRAVYSMAMSYLGIDVTPGMMSAIMDKRDLYEPYDDVTGRLGGVERVTMTGRKFLNMFRRYVEEDNYSPIMVHFRRPDGVCHAVLVISNDEGDRYIVVDPVRKRRNGEFQHVYRIRFDKSYGTIINSTFHETQNGSRVVGLYQWRTLRHENK